MWPSLLYLVLLLAEETGEKTFLRCRSRNLGAEIRMLLGTLDRLFDRVGEELIELIEVFFLVIEFDRVLETAFDEFTEIGIIVNSGGGANNLAGLESRLSHQHASRFSIFTNVLDGVKPRSNLGILDEGLDV